MKSNSYIAHYSEDKERSQSVYEHLKGTAEISANFAKAFDAEQQGYLAGIMHDIGKYSDAFQKRINGSSQRVDHSAAGALECCQRF